MKGHMVERRRGKALEDAVLDAAWSELLDAGYAGFTMEAVAARARTSRPVLYRRWPNRSDLALASIRHVMQQHPVKAPDTGNVRDDLLALLQQFSKNRAAFVVLSFQMSGYFSETNSSLADLRKSLLQGSHSQIDVVLARGVDRGEIDRSRLTPRIRSLLPDLLRHEFLMTLKPVPKSVIMEFVDEIFLPLVRTTPAREKKKRDATEASEMTGTSVASQPPISKRVLLPTCPSTVPGRNALTSASPNAPRADRVIPIARTMHR